jgi:predicted RNA methylase
MNYIKALKIYNDRKGEKNEWCVYKKGTPEYLEVMKIMKDFKEKPIKEKAVNVISNAFKIKQAKQELEKLKLEKAKKEINKIFKDIPKLEDVFKEIDKKNKYTDKDKQVLKNIIKKIYEIIDKYDIIKKDLLFIKDDIIKYAKLEKEIIDKKYINYNDFIDEYLLLKLNTALIDIKTDKHDIASGSNSFDDIIRKIISSFYIEDTIIYRKFDDVLLNNLINDKFNIEDTKKEINRTIKIRQAKQELEKLKLEKAKKELQKNKFLNDEEDNQGLNIYKASLGRDIIDDKLINKMIDNYNEIIKLKKDILNSSNYEDFINLKSRIEELNKDIKKIQREVDRILKEKDREETIKLKKYREENPEPKREKAANVISNNFKIRQAKQELEKLKLEKAKKEEAKKPEPKPKPEPEPEIIEIPEKSKKISTDDYVEISDNLDRNVEKYLPLYLPLFNINDLLGLLKFSRNDIKRLNIFLTPQSVADILIDYSGIINQYTQDKYYNNNVIYDILEPTAGTGNLIAELIEVNPNAYRIDAVEPVKQLYNIGKARFNNFNNIKWFNEDFLKFKSNKKYDYIFMNPPFNIKVGNKQYLDIDFINEAYKLLKDDGRLCAIISSSYVKGKTPKYIKFKDFIDNGNGEQYELNEGFKEDKTISKEMQTNIKMMIVIINKNEDIESIL